MKCLADTCIWIDFAKGNSSKEGVYFEEMLQNKLLYSCGLVKAEIIPFISDKKIQMLVENLFNVVSYLEDYDDIWTDVIVHQKELLAKGFCASIPDLLLTSMSMHYEVPILTHDKHFYAISKHIQLELIKI